MHTLTQPLAYVPRGTCVNSFVFTDDEPSSVRGTVALQPFATPWLVVTLLATISFAAGFVTHGF
jgi:hypothetical protein